MNFQQYHDKSWSPENTDAKKTLEEFKSNFSLMESEDDVMSMAKLIVHISGKLGEWEKGSELLKKLKNNATIKDKNEMNRLVAILNLGNNPNISIDNFSVSDQAIICAKTGMALAALGGVKNSEKLLSKASELALTLSKDDPALEVTSKI